MGQISFFSIEIWKSTLGVRERRKLEKEQEMERFVKIVQSSCEFYRGFNHKMYVRLL